MEAEKQVGRVSKTMFWTGMIVSAVPGLFMLLDGVMKLMKPAAVTQAFARLGYPDRVAVVIGVVELACVVAFAIPRTSILGAILLTGYLGGATASHVRIGDPFWFPILVGSLVWLGLFLRDDRLRTIVPLRN